ncbi:DNA-processing protein DprA [Anaerolineales bacterium]
MDNPERIWHISLPELLALGFSQTFAESFIEQRKKINLELELEKLHKVGAHLVSFQDPNYPSNLNNLTDSPPILYVKGTLIPEDKQAIAIVGTRKPSKYGRDVSLSIAKQLAEQGITIVSGLAQGIDAAAHFGAIKAQGRTIAVLGNGIDRFYPRENENLARDICKHGAVISEYPIGMPPMKENFPRRNRIISGLSLGVIIPEAPESSGALITASYAAEQGREVFAVPSNIFSPSGRGSNRLIQDGAKLIMRITDVLEEIKVQYSEKIVAQHVQEIVPENDMEKAILNLVGAEPIHIDDIIRHTGLNVQMVSSTLTLLELKGTIEMVGHMQYCRAH